MENRQPTYPGRVLITPENGEAYYATLTRADEPTVEGTPLNKQTLLQDATCAILDIPDTSVPNDAFVKLALGIGKYGYVIHVQYPDGSPAEGFTLTGLNAPDGTAAVTNENGDAVGVSTEQSVTIGVDSPYIDIQDESGISVESTGILTNYTVTLQSYEAEIQASGEFTFSPIAKTVDFCAIGGGGSGWSSADTIGAGGGGGYIQSLLNFTISNLTSRKITVQIGSGGVNSDGGNTTISANGENILTALGGKRAVNESTPGEGNGDGGTGNNIGYGHEDQSYITNANGKPATGYKFDDPGLGIPCGGGGGGTLNFYRNASVPVTRPVGGSPNGGMGGYFNGKNNRRVNGTNGEYPGGGGGSGPDFSSSGAQGCLFVRTHY